MTRAIGKDARGAEGEVVALRGLLVDRPDVRQSDRPAIAIHHGDAHRIEKCRGGARTNPGAINDVGAADAVDDVEGAEGVRGAAARLVEGVEDPPRIPLKSKN